MPKNWTNEDIEYLEDRWGQTAIESISTNLNRSNDAVILKAKKIGLGACYRSSEYVNASQISKIMGVDLHAVTDYWIGKCGLKAKKKALYKFKMWFINLTELMKWLKNNQDKWDSRKVELYALSSEPKWLKEKRKQDINIPKNKNQKWTKLQDDLLIDYYKMGKRQKEIGKLLNRSEDAVQRRLSRLKEKGLIKKDKIICKWSEREEKLFRELEQQGLKDIKIAEELGRDPSHVTDHRRMLRTKGLYQGNKTSNLKMNL